MPRMTAKMGLNDWNSLPDPYNYKQLDENWQIIDFHDHTPGRGVQIPMGGLAPGSVGAVQIVPGSITRPLLVPGAGFLTWRSGASSLTASSGDWIVASPGVTILLPPPSLNALIAITAASTVVGATPVTVNGTAIFGPGLPSGGTTSFVLGSDVASVLLQSNGFQWIMIAGQQDTGWDAIPTTPGAGVTSSVVEVRQSGGQLYLQASFTASAPLGPGVVATWTSPFGTDTIIVPVTQQTLSGTTAQVWLAFNPTDITTLTTMNQVVVMCPTMIQWT